MSIDDLSIGIPTHDGANTLKEAILSLDRALSKIKLREIEVLICANACTDNTIEIAKEISIQLPQLNIQVFEIPEKSKVSAMKKIEEYSRFNPLLFIDDDIELHPAAIEKAIEKLDSDPALRGVTALLRPNPRKPKALMARFWHEIVTLQFNHPQIYYQPRAYLAGAMLLIKKPLPKIPVEIINEDQFIAFSLWPRITDAQESFVYFKPVSSFRVFKNRLLRLKAGFKQIQTYFPPEENKNLYENLVRKVNHIQLAKLPAREKTFWYASRLLRWYILSFSHFKKWQRTYEKNH